MLFIFLVASALKQGGYLMILVLRSYFYINPAQGMDVWYIIFEIPLEYAKSPRKNTSKALGFPLFFPSNILTSEAPIDRFDLLKILRVQYI